MDNAEQQVKRRIDPALSCLVTVARMLGLPADYEQMRRAYVVAGAMNRVA